MFPDREELFQMSEDEFRLRIIEHIRNQWGEFLGKDAELLDQPGGLDAIQAKYFPKTYVASREARAKAA